MARPLRIRYPGALSLSEICAHEVERYLRLIRVGESGVCQAARRVTDNMKIDRRLKKRIDAMEKRFQA